MARACSPCIQEAEAARSLCLESSLVYKASSRSAKVVTYKSLKKADVHMIRFTIIKVYFLIPPGQNDSCLLPPSICSTHHTKKTYKRIQEYLHTSTSLYNFTFSWVMVTHAFVPRIWKAETDESL